MKAERTSLVNKFECEVEAVEILDKTSNFSLVNKAVGFVASVAVLSLVFMAGRQSGSWTGQSNMQAPFIGYPASGEKIETLSHLSENAASYDFQPGAADLVGTMNLLRKSSGTQLKFSIPAQKDNFGKLNPLMQAAAARSQTWAERNPTTRPDSRWYTLEEAGGSTLSTDGAVNAAFEVAKITPPISYKEYDFYGEYCTTTVFIGMKNGPSSASSPGAGINIDLTSKTWTNVAVSVGRNVVDASAPNTNGLGNAYWTIIFSTDYDWSPATRKPTRQPTGKPGSVSTDKPVSVPTSKPVSTSTNKPVSVPTSKPVSKPTATPTMGSNLKPTVKPTARPTVKPTARPTVKSTAKPTVKPTVKSTARPTVRPSSRPTARPTAKPKAV